MPKLKLAPIASIRPGNATLPMVSDKHTSATYDAITNRLNISIAGGSATLQAYYSDARMRWEQVDVTVLANAASPTAARINRLLQGTGAPRVEKYHRTNAIAVRAPGKAYDLPCTFTIEDKGAGWLMTSISTIQPVAPLSPAPPAPVVPAPHRNPALPNHLTPEEVQRVIDEVIGASGIVVEQTEHDDGTIVTTARGGINPPTTYTSPGSLSAEAHEALSEAEPEDPLQAQAVDEAEPDAESIAAAIDTLTDASEPMHIPQASIAEPTRPESEPAATPVKVAPKREDPAGIAIYPQRSTTDAVVTGDENRAVLETYWRQHQGGTQAIVAMVGPSGTGKTSLIFDFAADKSLPLFMFDAAGAGSFSDWTGTTVLQEGDSGIKTKFVLSTFLEYVRADGPYAGQERVCGIDEINRAETGGALNGLLPMLAQGSVNIPESGQTIYVDPKVMFIFTMNRGSAYNATLTLDAALADRVQAWVMLDWLDEKTETQLLIDRTGVSKANAETLVKAANQVRAIANRGELTTSVSIRRTLDAARAMVNGLTALQATTFCWANSFLEEGGDEGDRGRVITALNGILNPDTTTDEPF